MGNKKNYYVEVLSEIFFAPIDKQSCWKEVQKLCVCVCVSLCEVVVSVTF